MRRWIVCSVLWIGLLWGVTTAKGQALAEEAAPASAASVLHDAESAFRQGEYGRAVALYRELVEDAPDNPALLYNLGTAHARAGERGLAIWRYLQALRLDPRDADLRHNLRILLPDYTQNLAISPLPPINWVYLQLSMNEWTGIGAIGSLLALALLAASFAAPAARRRVRRALRWGAGAAFVVALVGWPFAILHYYDEASQWQGVVVSEGTVARTGPSLQQIETFSLPVGKVVNIEERTDEEWLKIVFTGGRKGYVPADRIRFL